MAYPESAYDEHGIDPEDFAPGNDDATRAERPAFQERDFRKPDPPEEEPDKQRLERQFRPGSPLARERGCVCDELLNKDYYHVHGEVVSTKCRVHIVSYRTVVPVGGSRGCRTCGSEGCPDCAGDRVADWAESVGGPV